MSTPQYVRHISGQGETYRLISRDPTWTHVKNTWEVSFELPTADYVWCEPKKHHWIDVTSEVTQGVTGNLCHDGKRLTVPTDFTEDGGTYRLRNVKVAELPGVLSYELDNWVFIVEQRQP